MAGRSGREEFEGIVGYFTDPVVLRANLAVNPTFKEFLAQVSRTVSEAKDNLDYPFPLLVKPQVSEAVVIDSEDLTRSKRLVAYVVTRAKSEIKNQLRSFLKQKLPDYMIPSAFVVLDALPLTPNGKVDRRGLPKPDTARLLPYKPA